MILTVETEVLGEKPVTVPLCPSQIPHGLAVDQPPVSQHSCVHQLHSKVEDSVIPLPYLNCSVSYYYSIYTFTAVFLELQMISEKLY
jgi:hypothetical protein